MSRLTEKQFHIAVFGRVSVGKSSLLNALMDGQHFSTSVLHGETKGTADIFWQQHEDHGLVFVDTPGIDEYQGERREVIAQQAIEAADFVLFVIDGDLTQTEVDALQLVRRLLKPVIVVINKSDRLTPQEIIDIEASVREKLDRLSAQIQLIFIAADPRLKTIIRVLPNGTEKHETVRPDSNVDALKTLIWEEIKASGHTLQAINAAVFATKVTDRIGAEIVEARADVANDIIRNYCIGKSLAVGLNPVPLLDVAVVFGDVAMARQLGQVYGFNLNAREASSLLRSVIAEMALVLGAGFGVQALGSVLKGLSAGLSTVLTAGTQGLAAWYGTYLVGKACEEYFKRGASWGEDGPEKVLKSMLKDIDKETIMTDARDEINALLKRK